MKRRGILLLLCLALLCPARVYPARAEAAAGMQQVYDGILACLTQQAGANDTQAWLDGALSRTAGGGGEWYVLALSRMGGYDFSAYHQALVEALAQQPVASASSRQKFALVLSAIGSSSAYPGEVMESSIGRQGIMSWIYGLHLLNNGLKSSAADTAGAVEKLLSLQLADGGWAISGTISDVDVTAMALQALAPHQAEPAVSQAVSRALELLSRRQMDTGEFSSYGVPNPESASQVLIALSALGIDGLQDPRFIKSGQTILDGLCRYRQTDGSFSHLLSGESNAQATAQVFCAAAAYQLLRAGKGSLYLFQPGKTLSSTLSIRGVAAAIILGLFLAGCGLLLLFRKRSWKNFALLGAIAALLLLFVFTTDFQSAERYYAASAPQKAESIGQVTLEIRCDTVAGRAAYIPESGVILEKTAFDLAAGDTVYTILTDAAQACKIPLDASGGPGMVYVSGIEYLYEFAYGDLSGWMYWVNGQSPSVGCDQYTLEAGDQILWQYSCELGRDLE